MSRKSRLWLLLGAFVIVLAIYVGLSYESYLPDERTAMKLELKQAFPDLQLVTKQGEQADLKTFDNKQKVIFVVTTTCKVCNEQKDRFDSFAKHLQTKGVVPLVIYQDKEQKSFKDFKNMEDQFYLNASLKLSNVTPTTIWLDEENQVLEVDFGDYEGRRYVEKNFDFTY
ncbi:hypothetical protein CIG75_20405 [Tumebacillus algifaecis]|uniref:Alkyl hydroperoxide reductase subunit C/ Thiol specific antioxidant domain-containing protein n=1 Tax=Tumebacillus algifaecis TaxID=1214604 RepID=A0A223D6A8_9BACL|nr:redoxin domain-containing protein [Tumebacillus algifaecis]ASS77030.1 hypothetical protein CIG75_20405 [Tumebacillus algifaecis]